MVRKKAPRSRPRDREAAAAALELKIKTSSGEPGDPHIATCVVRKGADVYKTVKLVTRFDSTTGAVIGRTLQAQSWRAKEYEPGFDFTRTQHSWHCDDEEIDKVHALLSGHMTVAGEYRIVRSGEDVDELLSAIAAGRVSAADLIRLLDPMRHHENVLQELAASDSGRLLSDALQLQRRRVQLSQLRSLVEDARSTEHQLHAQLRQMGWIFGGKYVGEAVRRQLTTEDTLDIPLLRGDGSLHVVELKRANISDLVHKHRSHYIPGASAHEAVSQAANYLRGLDEQRATILANHKIECRRAAATVLIGHSKFNKENVSAAELAETFRTYNSHLARIELMHYGELIDAAQRSLEMEADAEREESANASADSRWQDEPPSPDEDAAVDEHPCNSANPPLC